MPTREEVTTWLGENQLGTVDTIHRALCPDLTAKAVERHIAELKKANAIFSHTLYRSKEYVSLREKPFGAQQLYMLYAMLLYTVAHGVKRSTEASMEEMAPHLIAYGLSCHRYVPDKDGLGLLVCDAGGSIRHLVRKCRSEFTKRWKLPDWRLLIEHHMFTIIPIVPSVGKGEHLKRILHGSGIKVRPHVETELINLIGGKS